MPRNLTAAEAAAVDRNPALFRALQRAEIALQRLHSNSNLAYVLEQAIDASGDTGAEALEAKATAVRLRADATANLFAAQRYAEFLARRLHNNAADFQTVD